MMMSVAEDTTVTSSSVDVVEASIPQSEQPQQQAPFGIGSSTSAADATVASKITCDTLDLVSYISRYEGHTKIRRLMMIAERCSNLRDIAVELLVREVKSSTLDTKLYRQIITECFPAASTSSDACEISPNVSSSISQLDLQWIEETERKVAMRTEKIESDFIIARSKMSKEAIRASHLDRAEFHYKRGNLMDAMKSYLRTRDDCSSNNQVIETCLHLIRLCFDLGQYQNLLLHLQKAEQADNGDVVTRGKVKAATALIHLHEGHYKLAARKFLDIDPEVAELFPSVIAPEDIAVYGTLLALATLDRQEVKKSLTENRRFKVFLDLAPNMRALAQNFIAGQYSAVLGELSRINSQLLLDIFFSIHIDSITLQIKERVICQYFSPYNAVDLNRMSENVGMPVVDLERFVANLVSSGKLPARIDSQAKVLLRSQQDERKVTVGKVLRLAKIHSREVKKAILRLALMKNAFNIDIAEPQGLFDMSGLQHQGFDPRMMRRNRDTGGSSEFDGEGYDDHEADYM